ERVVLARGHLLQRRRVDDHVDAARREREPVEAADVAEEEAQARIVQLLLQLVLLQLVAAVDADGRRLMLIEQRPDECGAERPGAARDEDDLSLQLRACHGAHCSDGPATLLACRSRTGARRSTTTTSTRSSRHFAET